MKFFIDTADIPQIEELMPSGLIDGVTTNPSLVAKTGKNFLTIIEEICKTVSGPVSAEVAGMDFSQMIEVRVEVDSPIGYTPIPMRLRFQVEQMQMRLSGPKVQT